MNWLDYLPKFQPQEVRPNNATYWERDDCAINAIVNSISSQIFKLTGVQPDLSVRFLATVSKTNYPGEYPTPPWYGNTVANVFNALFKYGICTNATWPTDVSVPNPTFYATPSPEAYQEALAWRVLWLPQLISGIQASQVPTALLKAPLATEIVIGSPTDDPATGTPHLVEQLTATQYADSILGQPQVKSFTQPPISYSQVIINFINPMIIYQHQGSATLYFAVGSILIPFATDYNIYLANFANSPVIQLSDTEFAKFTIATNLAVKSLT